MVLTVPIEEIHAEAQARRVDVRQMLVRAVRAVWTFVLAVPYLLGWVTRKVTLGVTMLGMAVVLGWREAGRSRAKDGQDG